MSPAGPGKPIQEQFGQQVIDAFAQFARSDLKSPDEFSERMPRNALTVPFAAIASAKTAASAVESWSLLEVGPDGTSAGKSCPRPSGAASQPTGDPN